MPPKIPIHVIPLKYEFESDQDAQLYLRAFFPHLASQTPRPQSLDPLTVWIDEVITNLDLDRTGIKRPDKAIH